MNTRLKLFSLLLAGGILLFGSCKKKKEEVDNEPPVIVSFDVNEKASDIEVAAGDELHLYGYFTDNKELGQYKIDIHDAFDGHQHGKTAFTIPFSFQQVYALSGMEQHVHEHIEIPAEVDTGEYDLIVSLIDAVGNEADPLEIELAIGSPNTP